MRRFRIVLAGHGAFPAGLLSAAEMICGPLQDVSALSIEPGQTPEQYAERMRSAIGHDGRRVLVLCDLLGGTPFNVASAIVRRSPRVVCISGASLGLAVEAALAGGDLDEALVGRLLEAAHSGIAETERHRARRAS